MKVHKGFTNEKYCLVLSLVSEVRTWTRTVPSLPGTAQTPG